MVIIGISRISLWTLTLKSGSSLISGHREVIISPVLWSVLEVFVPIVFDEFNDCSTFILVIPANYIIYFNVRMEEDEPDEETETVVEKTSTSRYVETFKIVQLAFSLC